MTITGTGIELPAGFLDLPEQIYRDDPHWIPAHSDEVEARWSRDNPWFAHGDAHAFCVPGKARAAAFRQRGLEIDGEPAAFFGYFETTGDARATADVMDAVRSWSRDAGAARLYGPIDFSTASQYRVRLPGGDPRPLLGEPCNPPHYAAALEALGFAIRYRYHTYVLDAADIRRLAERRAGALDAARARGYRFEPLTAETWLDRIDGLYDVANAVFASNFAFTPFTRDEFARHFDARWASTLHPDVSVIVYGPAGDVAACFLIYPDYAPLCVQAAGSGRVPIEELSYARHGARLDPLGLVFKTGGVSPAHRRAGIAYAVAADAARRACEAGATTVYGGVIREDNPSGRVYSTGWSDERRYALYSAGI